MSKARVTFVVLAFGESAGPDLALTLRSLADCGWPAVGAAILTDPAGLPSVRDVLELPGTSDEPIDAPASFNKRPLGVPSFCLPFGEGAVLMADAVNEAVKEAGPTTDVFVPLRAGDLVHGDYCRRVVPEFEAGLGEVGAVYPDRFEAREGGDARVHEEPYSRERLLSRPWRPAAAAFARYALESVGGYHRHDDPTAEYDLWLRLTKGFVAVHVPHALARTRPRPADPLAWRRAVELAGWREHA